MLRLLPVEVDRVCRHCVLRAAKEKDSNHMASPVPSCVDPHGGMALSQIHFRWVQILFLIEFRIYQLNILGGNATFPNILNNFVHILMYFYYMLAAMGPQYQKFLWWKRYMTELQIVSGRTKAVLDDLTSVNLRVDFKQSSLRFIQSYTSSWVDGLESDLLACSLSIIERSVC